MWTISLHLEAVLHLDVLRVMLLLPYCGAGYLSLMLSICGRFLPEFRGDVR